MNCSEQQQQAGRQGTSKSIPASAVCRIQSLIKPFEQDKDKVSSPEVANCYGCGQLYNMGVVNILKPARGRYIIRLICKYLFNQTKSTKGYVLGYIYAGAGRSVEVSDGT